MNSQRQAQWEQNSFSGPCPRTREMDRESELDRLPPGCVCVCVSCIPSPLCSPPPPRIRSSHPPPNSCPTSTAQWLPYLQRGLITPQLFCPLPKWPDKRISGHSCWRKNAAPHPRNAGSCLAGWGERLYSLLLVKAAVMLKVGAPPVLFVLRSMVHSPSVCRLSRMTEHFCPPSVSPFTNRLLRSFPTRTFTSAGCQEKREVRKEGEVGPWGPHTWNPAWTP